MKRRLDAPRREGLYQDLSLALGYAGNPAEALEQLVEEGVAADPRLDTAVGAARKGNTLASALSLAFPAGLPDWELALLQMAEERGADGNGNALSELLRELARRIGLERTGAGQRRVALLYACVVLALIAAVAVGAAYIVVPNLAPAVAQLQLSEPAALERARSAAEATPVRIAGLLGVAAVAWVTSRVLGYERRHALLRRLSPGLAGSYAGVSAEAAGMVSALRLTLSAGGDMIDALLLLEATGVGVRGRVAAELFGSASAGSSLAEVFARYAMLPRDLSLRLSKAERYGLTVELLQFLEAELDRRRAAFLETVPQITTAAATIVAGAMLVWFVVSVVIPILTAFGSAAI